MSAFQELPLLSVLIFLPLVGAFFVLLVPDSLEKTTQNAKHTALFITLCTFFIALMMWSQFDAPVGSYAFMEDRMWIASLNIRYVVGVDGISLFFIILTTFLMPLCILASFENIKIFIKEFLVLMLILESLILGAFCVLDLVLFYIFFEAVLIPLFLIIGLWGSDQRIYAAYKFFFYTLAGSIFMLIGVLFIVFKTGTSNIPELMLYPFESSLQKWLWGAFFISFAIKIPMFPFHTWLPDAHVEAPTSASMILAGILLKMGAYGFIRLSLPFFPEACHFFAPFIWTLSSIAIVYAALITLVQRDMKKLIAYSSISHMGFVTLGIFTFTAEGLTGAMIQMLSHGLISAGLFLGIGILYDRMYTRDSDAYGGIAAILPQFSVLFMMLTLGAIGIPGTSGFVGEFCVMLAAFPIVPLGAVCAGVGIILASGYMLFLYRRVMFGPLEKVKLQKIKPLSYRETGMLSVLVGGMFWIGLSPHTFIDPMRQPILGILGYYQSYSKPTFFSYHKKESNQEVRDYEEQDEQDESVKIALSL